MHPETPARALVRRRAGRDAGRDRQARRRARRGHPGDQRPRATPSEVKPGDVCCSSWRRAGQPPAAPAAGGRRGRGRRCAAPAPPLRWPLATVPHRRRLAVRRARGAAARGDRSAGADRHAGLRRGRRAGRLRRQRHARLRQPGRAPARRRSADRLRAQLGAAGRAGAAGAGGRSHRAGRPERPRHRSPLALRGPARANSPGPDELPATARRGPP